MADTKKESVTLRAVSRDEEGRKRVEKVELQTHNHDSLKHVEKKLIDKGVLRQERHPVDGRGPVHKPPPKSGHGGKFTWEGPDDVVSNELEAPVALDEGDPNFVGGEERERVSEVEEERVLGQIEVAKVAQERAGVARVEVVPNPQFNSV